MPYKVNPKTGLIDYEELHVHRNFFVQKLSLLVYHVIHVILNMINFVKYVMKLVLFYLLIWHMLVVLLPLKL